MLQTFDTSVPLSEQRLKVALSKCTRKHGKRHAVGKRNSAIARAKKAASKAKVTAHKQAHRAYKTQVRAYWLGKSDAHP